MSLSVGSRLAHYDVTALIGEGGMGQVYQATDTKLNRQVALKILPEAFAADQRAKQSSGAAADWSIMITNDQGEVMLGANDGFLPVDLEAGEHRRAGRDGSRDGGSASG